jgi:hypothetical protein
MTDFTNPSSADEFAGPPAAPSKQWMGADAVKSLAAEANVVEDIDEYDTAKRIMRTNLPLAAHAIAHILMHSDNERLRMTAAQYVVDHALGKPTMAAAPASAATQTDEFADFMAECVTQFEDAPLELGDTDHPVSPIDTAAPAQVEIN